MQRTQFTDQQQLVERINKYYKPGDTITVRLPSGTLVEWTLAVPAEVVCGYALISVEEFEGEISADNLVFKRNRATTCPLRHEHIKTAQMRAHFQ